MERVGGDGVCEKNGKGFNGLVRVGKEGVLRWVQAGGRWHSAVGYGLGGVGYIYPEGRAPPPDSLRGRVNNRIGSANTVALRSFAPDLEIPAIPSSLASPHQHGHWTRHAIRAVSKYIPARHRAIARSPAAHARPASNLDSRPRRPLARPTLYPSFRLPLGGCPPSSVRSSWTPSATHDASARGTCSFTWLDRVSVGGTAADVGHGGVYSGSPPTRGASMNATHILPPS